MSVSRFDRLIDSAVEVEVESRGKNPPDRTESIGISGPAIPV